MEQSVSRDNKTCEAVLTRNADTVYRTAYLRVGNRHDAEDIMQDVFVRYMRYSPVFNDAEHEKAWFIRSTINLTKTFFTKAYRSREVPFTEDFPDPSGGPDEAGEVADAVMRLPVKLRTAVYLFYYENLPTKEIAVMMGKSDASVRVLLSRAREELRKALGEQIFEKE